MRNPFPLVLKLIVLTAFAFAAHAHAASDMTVEDLLDPEGLHSLTLSPDGKHAAAIHFSGTDHALAIIDIDTLKTTLSNVSHESIHGLWRYIKSPRKVTWVDNTLLAVDYGRTAESVDLQGKMVAVLGESVIGKADFETPGSTMMLVFTDADSGDVARVDARTGKKTTFRFPMRGKPVKWAFDRRGELRAMTLVNSEFWKDVSLVSNWYQPAGQAEWQKLAEFSIADEYWVPVGMSDRPDVLLVSSRMERDTYALFEYDTALRKMGTMVASHPTQDILFFRGRHDDLFHSVITQGMKPQTFWLDGTWAGLQNAVDKALPKRINILSGDEKNRILVYSYSDIDPGRYYVLQTQTMKLREVGRVREGSNPAHMLPMETLTYASKDGLKIPAYLTRPKILTEPAPAVLLIHGGPWVRDDWNWNQDVQFLASRGYVVLQPQFRGSAGFGKKFETAGYGQWGKAMQDDISAGVDYLVQNKIADPARICIVGASYGGYAAMWGLARDPGLYKCGVSFAGVADIEYIFKASDVNYDKVSRELMRSRIGDIRVNNQEFDSVSPLKHAGRITAPVLLMHGTEDHRVPLSHARKMKKALEQNQKSVELVEFQEEGHGLRYIRNKFVYYQTMAAFLDKHIGKGAGVPTSAPSEPAGANAR